MSQHTLAQKGTIDSLLQQYGNKKSIITDKKVSYTLKINDTGGVNITKDYYLKTLYTSSSSIYTPEDYYYYNSFSNIDKCEAFLYQYNGKKHKQYPVRNIVIQDSYDNSIFYNDSKLLQIIYPNVNKGSYSELFIRQSLTEPHLTGKYFFSEFTTTLTSELTVIVPNDISINFKSFNIDSSKYHHSVSSFDNNSIYKWKMKDIENNDDYNESFAANYYEPHVEFFIESYIYNGDTSKILETTNDLYNWYYSMVDTIINNNFALLDAFTDSLTKHCTSDLSKARVIYNWVQDNIKYVAFEEGYRGYIPHKAQTVFEKRFGDCKDMASILHYMLNKVGLHAYLCWVGTRSLPYSYYELPTPSVDNHMICALELNNDWYYLDATARLLPINLPSSFIQSKDALIGISKDSFLINTVPVIPNSTNTYTDSSFLRIENQTLIGSTSVKLNGYYKFNHNVRLIKQTPNDYSKFIEKNFERGSNKFRLDSLVHLSNPMDRDSVQSIKIEYSIPAYVKIINNTIYVNLNLNRDLFNSKIDTTHRRFHDKMKYKYSKHYYYKLSIPKGYSIKYIPESVNYSGSTFSFSSTYSHTGNEITLEVALTNSDIIIDKANFSEWNSMIDMINKSYSKLIVLTKI